MIAKFDPDVVFLNFVRFGCAERHDSNKSLAMAMARTDHHNRSGLAHLWRRWIEVVMAN